MGRRKNKNVYMGILSTARLPTDTPRRRDNPYKVDTPYEVALCFYATLYDVVNKKLLTRVPGQFKKANLRTLAGRLYIIRLLANRVGAIHLIPLIEEAKDIIAKYLAGSISKQQYLELIRNIATRAGLTWEDIELVERKIRSAERRR